MRLDLHGVRHHEVSKLLDAFIWENIKRNNKQIAIITGNSDIMKKVVKECLNDYGMEAREDHMNGPTLIVDL